MSLAGSKITKNEYLKLHLLLTISASTIKFILFMSYLVSCISQAITAKTTEQVNPLRELIFFCFFSYSYKNTFLLQLDSEFH